MNRLFKITHFVLMFLSVAGVADASRMESGGPDRAGWYPAQGEQWERERDRRYADLARQDRRRREDAQRKAGRIARRAGARTGLKPGAARDDGVVRPPHASVNAAAGCARAARRPPRA
ncbi:MAG TPA: hypothetical protein VF322_16995 [Gammaproteobacteria bacterium]